MLMKSTSHQEAHKMVRDANVKQAAAEKQLKEAQGKVSLFLCVSLLHLKVLTVPCELTFCPI